MANAPNVTINIWRDTDDPSVIWRLLKDDGVTPSDMPDGFELDVYWPGQITPMQYSSFGDGASIVLFPTTGDVHWVYTQDDSNRVPLGSKASYEVYGLSSGRRKFWFGGTVNVGTYRQ